MTAPGKVAAIYVASEARGEAVAQEEVVAVAGKGLEGDRYFKGTGTWSKKTGVQRQVTLIESEAVEAVRRDQHIDLAPGQTRRNILTEGVALNHLVGREFTVGAARLRGIKLCEPCGHLERLSAPGVEEAFLHRGGLNAEILEGGVIRVGDPVDTP